MYRLQYSVSKTLVVVMISVYLLLFMSDVYVHGKRIVECTVVLGEHG